MRKFFVFSAVLAAGFVLALLLNSSAAETDSAALAGTTTNRTTITSMAGDFFLKSNVFVYRGDVHVDNPQMKLRCELLVTEAPRLKEDEGRFDRATAETNVVIDWVDDKGPNHATAQKAIYTYTRTNTAMAPSANWQTNAFIILIGNPVVTNVQGVFRSDPIVWDRIKDVITTTNFNSTDIYQTPSNSAPGFFDTAPPPPAKKIAPKK
jgi:lipopolysaccharide export system protein LptA